MVLNLEKEKFTIEFFEEKKKFFLDYPAIDAHYPIELYFWEHLQLTYDYLLEKLNSENLFYLNNFFKKWGILSPENFPKKCLALFDPIWITEIHNNNYTDINFNLIASYFDYKTLEKYYADFNHLLDLKSVFIYRLEWSDQICNLDNFAENFKDIVEYYHFLKGLNQDIHSARLLHQIVAWNHHEDPQILPLIDTFLDNGVDPLEEIDDKTLLFNCISHNKILYAEHLIKRYQDVPNFINQTNHKKQNLLFFTFRIGLDWTLNQPVNFCQIDIYNTPFYEALLRIDLMSGSPIEVELFNKILSKIKNYPFEDELALMKPFEEFTNFYFDSNQDYRLYYELFKLNPKRNNNNKIILL